MIRRIAYALLVGSTLLTACKKETPIRITLSQAEVLLEGVSGAQATCRIAASGAWTLTVAGDGFEVAPQSGNAGETLLTITGTDENRDDARRTLGSIELCPVGPGAKQDIRVQQRPAVAPRSFFFFFIGTSLQEFFDANLQAALSAMDGTMPGDGRVAAFCRSVSEEKKVWEIVELHYDAAQGKSVMTSVEQFAQIDRKDPAFITRIVEKLKTRFPAREYGLAFGGHGLGWLPVGSSVYGPSTPVTGLAERKIATDGYPITRYYGETGSAFEVDEIAASLVATGTYFDYIIFDDCFMSNIESLYALRNTARYIIASPCEVMGDGFPYRYVIPAVMTPGAALEARLQTVCEKYYGFYLNEYDPRYPSGCVAMVDCNRLEALAEAAQLLFATGAATSDPTRLQPYEGLPRHLFYDFRQYAEQISRDAGALENFLQQFDLTFPPACRLHTPSFYSWYSRPDMIPVTYYSGVTCSAPSTLYREQNRQTEWWLATH